MCPICDGASTFIKICFRKSNIVKSKTGKKTILIIVVLAVIVIMANLFGPAALNKIKKDDVMTSSELEKAIDIAQLSTAEFVYNGIAEKYKDKKPEEVECYITYNAHVKVGIDMEDVEFLIDEVNRTVTPILPEININNAVVDESSFSYILENPDISLKDVITLCKEDVMKNAAESEVLYETAEENLKAVIEGLLKPILDNENYEIVW